jgi:predicted phage tail protein
MSKNLTTVRLYGELGDKFGHEFHFAVKTPAHAISLLKANFKEFGPYLVEHSEPGYHVFVDDRAFSRDDLVTPVPATKTIKIVPVVQGSGGDNPMTQIILGAALIYFTGGVGASGAWQMASTGVAGTVAQLGLAMTLGGVSQLLVNTPSPQAPADPVNNKASYAFNGAVNTIRQGNAVALCYGRLRVGSQVISAGMFAESI